VLRGGGLLVGVLLLLLLLLLLLVGRVLVSRSWLLLLVLLLLSSGGALRGVLSGLLLRVVAAAGRCTVTAGGRVLSSCGWGRARYRGVEGGRAGVAADWGVAWREAAAGCCRVGGLVVTAAGSGLRAADQVRGDRVEVVHLHGLLGKRRVTVERGFVSAPVCRASAPRDWRGLPIETRGSSGV